MAVTEMAIHEELKKVIDPELFVNVVDLGLVYVVNVIPQEGSETANVQIDMTLTSPACPAGPQLIADVKRVVSEMEGVGDVEVKIVMEPMWSPDRMTDEARDELGIF